MTTKNSFVPYLICATLTPNMSCNTCVESVSPDGESIEQCSGLLSPLGTKETDRRAAGIGLRSYVIVSKR